MKLPSMHSSIGFTLIELLVVVSIMISILSLGVASYNSFSQTQVLDGAAKTLRANLRLAQAFAINGEIIAGSTCTTTHPFNGYYVVLQDNATSYALGEYCGAATSVDRTPPSPVSLPPGVKIATLKFGLVDTSPITVLFKSISGAVFYNCGTPPCYTVPVNPALGNLIVTLTSGTTTRALSITSDGKIQDYTSSGGGNASP